MGVFSTDQPSTRAIIFASKNNNINNDDDATTLDVVLSAAHCAYVWMGERYVYVGARYLGNEDPQDGSSQRPAVGQVRAIVGGTIRVHPRFDEYSVSNDYLLFQIEPVTIPYIQPITLNQDDNYPVNGQVLRVIGMGLTSQGGAPSTTLRYTDVNAVDTGTCRTRYWNALGWYVDQDAMMCAAAPLKDACNGDSGGPIFDPSAVPPVQVGIVSFGYGCAQPGFPGVYARISYAIPWIKNIVCTTSISRTTLPLCTVSAKNQGNNSNTSTKPCKKEKSICNNKKSKRAGIENGGCCKKLACSRLKRSDRFARCRRRKTKTSNCVSRGELCAPTKSTNANNPNCCGSTSCRKSGIGISGSTIYRCKR